MAKKNIILIRLVSTAVKPDGQKTGYFYVTRKNPKSKGGTEKLNFKKYDPIVRKHVIFKEEKIK